MFRQIVFAAVLAGLIAGAFVTALQYVGVVPLILAAETYETGGTHEHGAAPAGAEDEDHAWAPAPGVERGLYTLATNILMAVGFALLLAAGFALTGHNGWRTGLCWGLAGYVAFTLAPAIGLPPEIPGAGAAPEIPRGPAGRRGRLGR